MPPPYVEAASDGYRLRRPYWVRLVRRGDVLTGLISPDGAAWTEVGSSRVHLGRDVYAGLATCGALGVDQPYAESTTAAFDNVTVQGWTTDTPGAPAGELRAGAAGGAVELAWSDLDVSATYAVKRRHAGGPYRVIASGVVPIGFGVETRYRDVTAVPGQSYDYVVAKTNAAGTGPDSSKLTMTMPTPAVPSMTSAGSAFANIGTEFRFMIAASNDPISFAVTGLPDGLSLDRKTGVISGRPLRVGTVKLGVSARNAAGVGAAEVTLTVGAPPPAPWRYADIGDYVLDERQLGSFSAVAIRTPGITSYDGQFTVRGAGSDLNVIGQGMTVQYAYQAVTGDATFTARIVSRGGSGRVGLLMTKSLSPFDQLAGVVLDGGTPQFVQRLRVATGLVTTTGTGTGTATWLRIRRTGNAFAAEVSPDGESWTAIGAPGQIDTFGSAPYYVGLAVVSGAPFALSTTVFDDLLRVADGAEAGLVEAATVRAVVAAAALRPHLRGHLGDVRDRQTLPPGVVEMQDLPDRPDLTAAGTGDHRVLLIGTVLAGAPGVFGERHVLAEVVLRDVLRGLQEAVVVVAVQVVTLVPGHLAERAHLAHSHHRVALVAAGLLPLRESLGVVHERDGVLDRAVARAGLEVVDGLVVLRAVVAEDRRSPGSSSCCTDPSWPSSW